MFAYTVPPRPAELVQLDAAGRPDRPRHDQAAAAAREHAHGCNPDPAVAT
ncbi:MAG TPA: hypothetical protein VMV92_11660 [Streptosporangiaceae bacterium]|nr:hypothetical protein [Streptosporangiaceae bacterium]